MDLPRGAMGDGEVVVGRRVAEGCVAAVAAWALLGEDEEDADAADDDLADDAPEKSVDDESTDDESDDESAED